MIYWNATVEHHNCNWIVTESLISQATPPQQNRPYIYFSLYTQQQLLPKQSALFKVGGHRIVQLLGPLGVVHWAHRARDHRSKQMSV